MLTQVFDPCGGRIRSDGTLQLMRETLDLDGGTLEYVFGERNPLELDDYQIIEKGALLCC